MFRGSAGTFFLKKICWLLLTIITFGIFGLWIKIKTLRWQFSNTFLLREGEEAPVNLSSLKGTVQKKENKTVLYIILGIVGLIVLIVLFKILSFFGPSNPTIEEEMKTVAYNTKEEIMTNGINPDDDLGRGSMMKKIEKLNLNSLDEFNKNHGK